MNSSWEGHGATWRCAACRQDEGTDALPPTHLPLRGPATTGLQPARQAAKTYKIHPHRHTFFSNRREMERDRQGQREREREATWEIKTVLMSCRMVARMGSHHEAAPPPRHAPTSSCLIHSSASQSHPDTPQAGAWPGQQQPWDVPRACNGRATGVPRAFHRRAMGVLWACQSAVRFLINGLMVN